MSYIAKITVLLLFFCFACRSLQAQNSNVYQNEYIKFHYNLKNWNTADGLPVNILGDITQSHQGYLWIASYQGIIRFDGFTFKVFNSKNTSSLREDGFKRVERGRDSTLWFLSNDRNIYTYKKGRFQFAQKPDSLIALKFNSPNHFYTYKNNELHFFQPDTTFSNIQLNVAERGSDGTIYFGTSRGLIVLKNKTIRFYGKSNILKNPFIVALYSDHEEKLWVGTTSGLFAFAGDKLERYPDFNQVNIKYITADSAQNLWIGAKDGLYLAVNGEKDLHLTTARGLPINFVSKIFFDKENNGWILTHGGGIVRIKKEKMQVLDKNDGMKGTVVNTICERFNNEVLIGFDNGIIQKIGENEIQQFQTKKNLLGLRVRHIYEDSKRTLWISTYGGLLKKTARGDETFFSQETGFPTSLIRVVSEDHENNIWVGTRDKGLVKIYPDNSWKLINKDSGLSHNLIMSVQENENGDLLVGTAGGGLNIIKNDTATEVINKENGMHCNTVFNTYTDWQDVTWIANSKGLSRLKNHSIVNFSQEISLAGFGAYDAIEDQLGNLWLPFSKGLVVVAKKHLNAFARSTKQNIRTKIFERSDGVPIEGLNPVAKSIQTTNGKLWFPTLNGVLTAEPKNINKNTLPPQVHIQTVQIDEEIIKAGEKITIEPGAHRISIEFTAICLQAPEKVQFKYKLQGYESKWIIKNSHQRSVSYTNLSPGHYDFILKAANNDGVWNQQGDKLHIYLKPFWYETSFFYISSSLILIVLVYILYLMRIRQLKMHQKELEDKIEQHTAEIRKQNDKLSELNATKDKFFNIIAHDLKNPFNSILGLSSMLEDEVNSEDNKQLKDYAHLIVTASQEAYKLLENLLEWSRSQSKRIDFNPKTVNSDEIIISVLGLVEGTARKKNISISYDPKTVPIYADIDMLKTILRNLLTNAIKFTHTNGQVSIAVYAKKSYVEISVTDTGVGMDKKTRSKLFKIQEKISYAGTNREKGTGLGLILCKEFVNKHNGEIWVETEPGKGSRFIFTLPYQK